MAESSVMRSGLFRSFWLAGFESACQINSRGQRINMLAATGHDQQTAEDFARLHEFGISTVREGISWPCIETAPGRYDFSSLLPMVEAANLHRTQVIWTLCHYGWPDDIDVFSPVFVKRFARYCKATAEFIESHYHDDVPFYTPVNEISFLSWAGGYAGFMNPHRNDKAWELKKQYVRASIAGMNAILSVNPQARFVHIDPLIHVVTPRNHPELAEAAAIQRESQFEAWEMIAGRRNPELGGHERYLDIVGVNFYHANQWEFPDDRLRWEDTPRDERWIPLHRLLEEVYERMERPLFIAETSHFGEGRGTWITEVTAEVGEAMRRGLPIEGICLYPILDRPDWEDMNIWHNSGLWDLMPDHEGKLQRVLNEPYAEALRQAQTALVHSLMVKV
jgi:hypothetical protein